MLQTNAGFAKLQNDSDLAAAEAINYGPMVNEVRQAFLSGKTKSIAWRRSQLEAVIKMYTENHEAMTAAVRADLGSTKIRGVFEMLAAEDAHHALSKLEEWTAPQAVPTPMTVSPTMMGKSYIRQEPKGVILIIGPWNFPIELIMHPLVSAIAAGNCCVIKPSEVAANCGALMEKLIPKYLDSSCIKVVSGAVPETTALLKERWDHIFYTGNGFVGRVVLRAAAEHLTPVTLELGGKSPVIVDKTASMRSVIERVASAKFLNAGQICVAPDYVLVHKDREQELVDGVKARIKDLFTSSPKESPHMGRIITPNHVKRVAGLVSATKGEVVAGGIGEADPEARYMPPTVVRNANIDEPLLKEEIFGPVLPIVPVSSVQEAVERVNTVCDQPLALYIYSEDKGSIEYILDHTASGGVAVNTSVEHLMNPNLPFGGVGTSGHGAYHGKAGFDEFTHRRSVLHQDTLIMRGAAIPPQPPDSMYDLAVKMNITGFLSTTQKRLLMAGAAAAAGLAVRSRL